MNKTTLKKMLIVTEALSRGATRACYRHPNDPCKCVKILFNPKKIHLIYKQLKNNEEKGEKNEDI